MSNCRAAKRRRAANCRRAANRRRRAVNRREFIDAIVDDIMAELAANAAAAPRRCYD